MPKSKQQPPTLVGRVDFEADQTLPDRQEDLSTSQHVSVKSAWSLHEP